MSILSNNEDIYRCSLHCWNCICCTKNSKIKWKLQILMPNIILNRRWHLSTTPKGQLISEGLFGAFTFSQKTNENKSTSSKDELFRSFFGRKWKIYKTFWKNLTFKLELLQRICFLSPRLKLNLSFCNLDMFNWSLNELRS